MKRVLFLCSRNRLRSPTAEAIFSDFAGVEVDSAGLAPDAEVVLSLETIHWAEIIFVMEKAHRIRLKRRFGNHLSGKRVICLDIGDGYDYMDSRLVKLLEARVTPHLR